LQEKRKENIAMVGRITTSKEDLQKFWERNLKVEAGVVLMADDRRWASE